MRKEEIKEQLWTIPNLITYFRILCIPFFIWLTLDKNTYTNLGGNDYPLIGFIVIVVAATSDLFDGMLARKLNQTTAIGAALDPIADKLMHMCAVLCLTIIGFVHWAFLVALALKEILMIIGGIVLVKYSQPIKANYVGKIASVLFSAGIFMSFFHPLFAEKVFYLDWIVICLALVVTYIAFAGYLSQAIPVYKIVLKALKEKKDPNDYFSNANMANDESVETFLSTSDEEEDKPNETFLSISDEEEDKPNETFLSTSDEEEDKPNETFLSTSDSEDESNET